MGRLTQSFRMAFNEKVEVLRREYRDALKDRELRQAFEKLVGVWSSEMGAMTYAETIPLFDLMLLTTMVEERRMIEDLSERIKDYEIAGSSGCDQSS